MKLKSLAIVLLTSVTAFAAEPTSQPSFALQGFATLPAYGVQTTTGGAGGKMFEVHNADELLSACEKHDIKDKKARDDDHRIIQIMNDIDLGPLNNEKPGEVIKSVGRIEIGSNITLYSTSPCVTIRHGVLETHGSHNVIIRNLKFRELWENDPTGKYDRLGWDYVRITNSGAVASHHVWVDHCDFGKAYDGQLDITHGSDLITVSWNKFAGDEHGPHKKSMLIGHSSGASAEARDNGKLNVTLHHNFFSDIDDRAPRARFGNIHIFNQLVDGATNATISVSDAVTLVENSIYRDTKIATTWSHAADSEAKSRGGTICIVNSLNENPRKTSDDPDPKAKFEIEHNFTSSVDRDKLQFNKPADWKWENLNQLPYQYDMEPTEKVEEALKKFTGTGVLTDADLK
jgi:pectate lyase